MRPLTKILMATTIAAAGAAMMSNWPERTEVWAQSAYTSPNGDFSISFPVAPQAAGHNAQSADDPGLRTYVAESDGGSYQVRVDEYPTSIPVPAPNQTTYQLLLRSHAVESSSHLTSTVPIQFGGRASVEGVFAYPSGATERRRVVMIDHLIYQVSYTHTEGVGTSGDGAAFFESFRLVAR